MKLKITQTCSYLHKLSSCVNTCPHKPLPIFIHLIHDVMMINEKFPVHLSSCNLHWCRKNWKNKKCHKL